MTSGPAACMAGCRPCPRLGRFELRCQPDERGLVAKPAVIGLRLGERRTLAQLGAFDFAVAVAIGAIIGGTVTTSSASFATGAVALVALLVVHRLVAFARRHSRIARIIDHPPRVLVTQGKIQDRELARVGLTAADLCALLRQQGVDDLGQVGYLLYETRGVTTVIGADGEPGPLMRDGLFAAGYRDVAEPVERHARQQHQRMLPDDGIHDSSARTRR